MGTPGRAWDPPGMLPHGPILRAGGCAGQGTASQGHFPSAFYFFPCFLTTPLLLKLPTSAWRWRTRVLRWPKKRKGWVSMATPFPNEGCGQAHRQPCRNPSPPGRGPRGARCHGRGTRHGCSARWPHHRGLFTVSLQTEVLGGPWGELCSPKASPARVQSPGSGAAGQSEAIFPARQQPKVIIACLGPSSISAV